MDDGKKRFCCRFPTLYREWGSGAGAGAGGVGVLFLQHKLDEEDFDISNHQKFMRHTMRLERREGLYPCLEGGRQMEDDTGG